MKDYPHWILRLVAESPALVILDSDEMGDYEWKELLPSLVERMPGVLFLAAPGGDVKTLSSEEAKAVLAELASREQS